MCPVVPMLGRVLRSRSPLFVALSLVAIGNPTGSAHPQQVGSPPQPGIAMPQRPGAAQGVPAAQPGLPQQPGFPPQSQPYPPQPGYPSPGSSPQQAGYGSGTPPGVVGTAPMPGGTWSWPPQTQVWPVQPGAQEIVAPDPGTQPLAPGVPTQTVVPEWIKPPDRLLSTQPRPF